MIKPLNKNVLLKSKASDTFNGIYMPTTNTVLFEVVGVGSCVLDVTVGNTVIVDRSAMKEINYNHQVFYLIDEKDILGIVEE